MTPDERKLLEKMDQMILNASVEELKKIQEFDIQTQMNGLSFYDALVNSKFVPHQSVKQKTRESKK